jgi:hypothetical protein
MYDFAFTSAFASTNNRHFSTSFGQEPQCRAVCPLREHAESYIVQNETKATQPFSSMHVRGEVGGSCPLSFVCTSAFASMSNRHFLKTCITTIWTRSQHERRPSSTKATRLQAARLCSSAHLGRGAYGGSLVVAFTSAFSSMSNRQASKSTWKVGECPLRKRESYNVRNKNNTARLLSRAHVGGVGVGEGGGGVVLVVGCIYVSFQLDEQAQCGLDKHERGDNLEVA